MTQDLINYIGHKNPLHLKKLQKNLSSVDGMQKDLESFLSTYRVFMNANNIREENLADAYLELVEQMSCARIAFLRTGKYPLDSHQQAVDGIYNNKELMTKYMLGLGVSQFLWKHHYQLFNFYRQVAQDLLHAKNCLEVGSGHGLFLLELFKIRKDIKSFDVVDLSPTSLALTRDLLSVLNKDAVRKVRFTCADVGRFESEIQYDFITMGEVLEHVERPLEILESLKGLLKDEGRIYISTCVNCPAIDHLFQFNSIKEVRDFVKTAGFEIEHEIIAPSEDVSAENLAKFKLDISYGALLKKTNGRA